MGKRTTFRAERLRIRMASSEPVPEPRERKAPIARDKALDNAHAALTQSSRRRYDQRKTCCMLKDSVSRLCDLTMSWVPLGRKDGA